MKMSASVFHRKVGLNNLDGIVAGEICDNLHHFRVWLYHDNNHISDIKSQTIRYPWSTCPQAGSELEPLAGSALDKSSTAVGRAVDATTQCTHLFDLAGLMMAHAANERPPFEYHCQVSGPDNVGTQATLSRNGEPLLNWQINDGVIEADAPYQGVKLEKRFIQWAEDNLELEEMDAALILRRTLKIAGARFVDLTEFKNAAQLAIPAHCYSLQPQQSEQALSMHDMTIDWEDRTDEMLTMWEEDSDANTS